MGQLRKQTGKKRQYDTFAKIKTEQIKIISAFDHFNKHFGFNLKCLEMTHRKTYVIRERFFF